MRNRPAGSMLVTFGFCRISKCVLLIAAILILGAKALAAPLAYSVSVTRTEDHDFVSSYFAELDLATGAIRSIAPLVEPEIVSLAFQPATGVLFGTTYPLEDADNNDIENNLVTINPNTGQVSVVGSFGFPIDEAFITFDSSGTLYMVGDPNTTGPKTLFTLNPTTAIPSAIGLVGFPVLGIVVADGGLYGITGTFGLLPSQLIKIDLTTGVGSSVGPIGIEGIGDNYVSVSASADGTVYALDTGPDVLDVPSSKSTIFTVNLQIGAGTLVTTTEPGFQGLAIQPVPEPAAVTLLLTGLVELGLLRRRQRCVAMR